MNNLRLFLIAAAFMASSNEVSLAALKEVPYPAIKVELAEAFTPDEAYEKTRKALQDAVAKKDAQALFSLVGPSFVWLSQGALSDQFDVGREALHNFKVVLGFRAFGKDQDSAPADTTWAALAEFAAEKTWYVAGTNLVCGPISATIADDSVFERASQRIGADESVVWYFTIADTVATATPADTGAPVGRMGQVALPVLNTYPATPEGQSGPPPTHLQVLLPSGRNGWIPISAARPLATDRLCFAATSSGEWKIAAFDQAQ